MMETMARNSYRHIPCKKEGMCFDGDGAAISDCRDAPPYKDYAWPLSENLCSKSLADHIPEMSDPYKETYVQVCHQLDETLADPYLSTENLDLRFSSFAGQLDDMITSSDFKLGDNGRYLYHIDARMLQAYLPAFYYRAQYGSNEPLPREIIDNVYRSLVDILADFDSLYRDIAVQVALRRTEVEIPVLLLRSKRADSFMWLALFREDASATRAYNHDGYGVVSAEDKIPVQIKTTDYRRRGSDPASSQYHDDTALAIHQHVVNLDFIDGETHVTVVEPTQPTIDEEVEDAYGDYEEMPRFVAWGASKEDADPEVRGFEYIQEIGGYRRDGLIDAIVREARGDKLTIEELNLLNGATHYLVATMREKASLKR
jgi:hypothetical protein